MDQARKLSTVFVTSTSEMPAAACHCETMLKNVTARHANKRHEEKTSNPFPRLSCISPARVSKMESSVLSVVTKSNLLRADQRGLPDPSHPIDPTGHNRDDTKDEGTTNGRLSRIEKKNQESTKKPRCFVGSCRCALSVFRTSSIRRDYLLCTPIESHTFPNCLNGLNLRLRIPGNIGCLVYLPGHEDLPSQPLEVTHRFLNHLGFLPLCTSGIDQWLPCRLNRGVLSLGAFRVM